MSFDKEKTGFSKETFVASVDAEGFYSVYPLIQLSKELTVTDEDL